MRAAVPFLAASIAALAGCAGAPPIEQSAAARGRDYAVSNCAGCHSIDVKGVSRYRAAPPFRRLRGDWNGASLQVRLERSPFHGTAEMPPHPLSAAEADDIAAFIHAVRAGEPPPGPPPRATICNPMSWC